MLCQVQGCMLEREFQLCKLKSTPWFVDRRLPVTFMKALSIWKRTSFWLNLRCGHIALQQDGSPFICELGQSIATESKSTNQVWRTMLHSKAAQGMGSVNCTSTNQMSYSYWQGWIDTSSSTVSPYQYMTGITGHCLSNGVKQVVCWHL